MEWTDGTKFKPGDVVTIGGRYKKVPNPNRRWWQLWKPRTVQSDELAEWRVEP